MRHGRCAAIALVAGFALLPAAAEPGRAADREGAYLGARLPGVRPERFLPDLIATPPGVHSSPVISPDGSLLLWSPMSRQGETRLLRWIGERWSAPETVDFGMGQGVGEPCFAPDGRRLYFLSFKPTPTDDVARERIWFVDRRGEGWSPPQPIDSVVAAHPTHWQFSVAANYNLYFTSEIAGVRGEQDIYRARYADGRYLPPEDLGPAINSDGIDLCPFVAPDERYLLFARKDAGTRGCDLFVSFRNEAGGWTPAVPLGDGINTEGHELCPVVSPDGRFLFYTGPVPGGFGVWWVDAGILVQLPPSVGH